VTCGRIDPATCRQVVRASLEAVGTDVRAIRADVYPSLVCGDDTDCPRSLLATSSPVGSVTITYQDGASAWINILAPGVTTRLESQRPAFLARVVRSFPPPA
jgi:hypothetical protein